MGSGEGTGHPVEPRARRTVLRSGGIALLAVVVLAARPQVDEPTDDPPIEEVDRLVADRCRAGDRLELIGERTLAVGDRCILLRHRPLPSDASGEVTSIDDAGRDVEVAMLVRLQRLGIWIAYFGVPREAPPPLEARALSDLGALAAWRSSPRVRAVPIPSSEPSPLDEAIAVWLATRRAEEVMPPPSPTEEPDGGR